MPFHLKISTLRQFIDSLSAINWLKANISSNQLALLDLNQRVYCIPMYHCLFVDNFLNPLSFLQHSLLSIILEMLYQIQCFFPFLELFLQFLNSVWAVVFAHLNVILIECLLHMLVFLLRGEDYRLFFGWSFLTTLKLYFLILNVVWNVLVHLQVLELLLEQDKSVLKVSSQVFRILFLLCLFQELADIIFEILRLFFYLRIIFWILNDLF